MIDDAPIKTTVEELRKLVNISNYIGEPIETEDKILIPVSKAAVGFGIGEHKKENEITGTGAGVSVEPTTMVVVTKGKTGAEGIRTINLTKGSEGNKALNELGLIITDIIKDLIPSQNSEDDYINVDDITEVEIKDGEIREKAEDIVDDAEEKLDIEIDDE
ncbi:spore germination protein GerW family protein [Methanobrevibacter sp.]|uniref:GerW family sporulation protein n=1 Tax=Methanobrevibacter sp. TaxID=66852 RepID=UPI0025D77DCC|nr:spore germination protein GerW family protein [Methanobrevibacter sp.]MBQ2962753.1 sporulation protein [Methanobrevibacter sp.]